MIAPKDESNDLVLQWLETEGLKSCSSSSGRGDSIIVEASVTQAEKLLNAEYSAFGNLTIFSLFPSSMHRFPCLALYFSYA